MDASPGTISSFRKKFWLFTALTIAFIAVMRIVTTPLSGEAIVRFELAKTIDKATRILNDWQTHRLIGVFSKSVYLDFIFIVLYTAAFFFACRFISGISGHFVLQKAGYGFAWLAPVAGICDVLENASMLKTVQSAVPSAWVVKFTYHMSAAKFSILIILVLFMFVSLIMWLLGKLIR